MGDRFRPLTCSDCMRIAGRPQVWRIVDLLSSALPEKLANRLFFDPPCVAGRVKCGIASPSPKRSLVGEGRTRGARFGEGARGASTVLDHGGRPTPKNSLNACFSTLPASPEG